MGGPATARKSGIPGSREKPGCRQEATHREPLHGPLRRARETAAPNRRAVEPAPAITRSDELAAADPAGDRQEKNAVTALVRGRTFAAPT